MNLIVKFFILALIIQSAALSSGVKRSNDEEALESGTIIQSENKRAKTSVEEDVVVSLLTALEKRHTELFANIIRKRGCDLLDPSKNEVLKRVIESKNSEILYRIFSRECPQRFDLYMEAVKMATEMKDRTIIYALIKTIYDPFAAPPNALLNYFIERKDFASIGVFIELDFVLDYYRGPNGKGLVHVLVENNQYSLLKSFKRPLLFALKDNSGKTPIFYARNRKMIKIIRKRVPGLRDSKNLNGVSAWQEAFLLRDFERLNALISPVRRLKKYKRTFLNFYRIGWISTATILKIDRKNLLKSSLAAVQRISAKWFKPKHEFFIKFIGENGMDNGGLKVDWINSLINAFFTENEGGSAGGFTAPLFKKIDDETGVYAPNIEYNAAAFKFAGSIIALSIALNVPIKVKFIPAIYRALCNEVLDLEADLIEQSPTVYRHLQYLLRPDVDLRQLDLPFPENPNMRASKRNLTRYIQEYSRYTLQGRYKNQIAALAAGFFSVQSVMFTKFLYKPEFIRVLQGKSDYSMREFIEGCKCADLGVLQSLGHIVAGFTPLQRAKLLKFITGSESLPFEGFSGLKNGGITVTVTDGLSGPWPTSSTCFATLKIAPFDDVAAFKELLTTAIETTDRIDLEPDVAEDEGIELGLDDGTSAALNSHDLESESDVSDDDFESENSAFTRVASTASRFRSIWAL